MKTASSAFALISVLIACLAFVFVWAGTESVHFDWVSMDDDQSIAQLETALHPPEAVEYTDPEESMTSKAAVPDGVNFVLWINVSGFRGDYLENADTPFFDRAVSNGSHTSELNPVFPSLHYPCLVSQATGLPLSTHEVTADSLRHPESGEILDPPTDLTLMKGEPIWTTAKRQGLGVIVHHWPFSHEQPSEHAADHFLTETDPDSSAEDRLNALLEAWSSHEGESKIRLAMTSLNDIKKASMTYGSREQETYDAVTALDGALSSFRDRLEEKWPELRNGESDKLHLFITTDHGMTDAKKVINFGVLMGDLAENVDYVANGGIAHLWFKDIPEGADREKFEAKYDDELKARIYWRSYKQDALPENWMLGTGPQIGERFLVLKSGYAFTDGTGSEPVFDPSETGGPFSASGYSVMDQSRMLGQAFFTTLDGDSYGSDLGSVDSTQLHPTVAKLLGIKSAEGVEATALRIE